MAPVRRFSFGIHQGKSHKETRILEKSGLVDLAA